MINISIAAWPGVCVSVHVGEEEKRDKNGFELSKAAKKKAQ